MIFDFHAHSVFKPFNSRSIYDEDGKTPDQELWKERFRPRSSTSGIPKALESEVNYTSQIHLNDLAESGVRGVCVSLYPLERVFTVGFKKLEDSILFHIISELPGIGDIIDSLKNKKFFFKLIATLTGYDRDVIFKVHNGSYNYYDQLNKELEYLIKYEKKSGGYRKIGYEIAKNYTHYKKIVKEGRIAYLISVEGTNVFLGQSRDFDKLVEEDLKGNTSPTINLLNKNLEDFKGKSVPLFVITLAHHQYNFLCGHSPSFISVAKAALNQEGYTLDPANPKKKLHYFLVGLKKEGKEFIRNMLSKSFGGRRVLLDTKHMSPKARSEYHKMIFSAEFKDDDIPIIQTHTAVNGRKKMSEVTNKKNIELSKKEQKESHFSTGAINLFDDEIVDIMKSGGMLGIMLDEKRIVGKKLAPDTEFYVNNLPAEVLTSLDDPNYRKKNETAKLPENRYAFNKQLYKKAINRYVKANRKLAIELNLKNPRRRKVKKHRRAVSNRRAEMDRFTSLMEPIFTSILCNQFVYIVNVYKDARAKNEKLPKNDPWKHLCIGSDYEGVINPLDTYFYSSGLGKLKISLEVYFTNALSNSHPAFDKYRKAMKKADVVKNVQNILWDNSDWFLKKYFNDSYLT